MHDVMRARLLRKLESLPEDKLYQVLDYIEFLESRHTPEGPARARGLQALAERLEDGMRSRRVSPKTIGRAMTAVGAAGRVARTVAAAGRQAVRTGRAILDEVDSGAAAPERRRPRSARPAAETSGSAPATGSSDASPPDDGGNATETVVPIE